VDPATRSVDPPSRNAPVMRLLESKNRLSRKALSGEREAPRRACSSFADPSIHRKNPKKLSEVSNNSTPKSRDERKQRLAKTKRI
jgi:hypothetical protein